MQAMHLSASEITLRSEDFFKQNGIDLKLGKEVGCVSRATCRSEAMHVVPFR